MTGEHPSQPTTLHEETRTIWNQNAASWDERMGESGNLFQRTLVAPTSERLLNLQPGETVLEIACGNGIFARQMARLGTRVIAMDYSQELLERARARSAEYVDSIDYRLVDATREEQIVALGQRRFDAAVCNMAIMDMSEIDPLMRGIRQVLKPGGRFVFVLFHPCFNHSGVRFCGEEAVVEGEVVSTHALKVTNYLHSRPQKGITTVGLPALQYYFDRPLHVLFNACFQAGLVMERLEEPVFDPPAGAPGSTRLFDWANYKEIPPILAARLRIPNETNSSE